jgi:hypothetical protein
MTGRERSSGIRPTYERTTEMTTFIAQDSIATLCTYPGDLPTGLLEALATQATGPEMYDLANRPGLTAAQTRALYDRAGVDPTSRGMWWAVRGHLSALGTGPDLDSFLNEVAQLWWRGNARRAGDRSTDVKDALHGLRVTQTAYLLTSSDAVAAAMGAAFGGLQPADQLTAIEHVHTLLPDLPEYSDNRREVAAALTQIAISALRNMDTLRGQIAIMSATTAETIGDFQLRHAGYLPGELEHLVRVCLLPSLEAEDGLWSEHRTQMTLDAVKQHGWHLAPELLARIAVAVNANDDVRLAATLPRTELVLLHQRVNGGGGSRADVERRERALADMLEAVGPLDANQWTAALRLIRLLPPTTTYSQATAVLLTTVSA